MSNVGGSNGNVGGGSGVSGAYAADLYAYCDGTGTPSVTKSSSNVTGITDRATGRYTITSTALPSANGSVAGMGEVDGIAMGVDTSAVTRTTTALPILLMNTASVLVDYKFSVTVTGS